MKKFIYYIVIATILLGLSGCSGSIKNMQIAQIDNTITKPKEGKAKIIFMRPNSMAFGIQSSLFEIIDNEPSILSIVAAKKKVSHSFNPGKHLFMIVGESADFMYADLQANKIYYTLVTPRMGLWKARFSLKPLTTTELNSKEFQEWLSDSQVVESNADTKIWAKDNKESIKEKYLDYYEDWMKKDESKRPKLIDYMNN